MEYYRTFRNFGNAMAFYKKLRATYKRFKRISKYDYIVTWENY